MPWSRRRLGGCEVPHLAAADVSTTVPAASAAVAAQPGGFKYFVGIVGNPSVPEISWSDEELEQIKALGVNVVQLSIAWGHKPADEVLNLEDLDAGQREIRLPHHPIDVQLGATDGIFTEVSGSEVREGMEVVVGEDRPKEGREEGATTNPFAPKIAR